MPQIQILFLWHQHQPFYKDLVTRQYRLPWVRMHALKDYYGMVKLLDEFPSVHQTFNLVPSLVAQIQDYLAGTAYDPFFEVAAKPARDLKIEERRFMLLYFFQANEAQLIGRYPRYRELFEQFRSIGQNADRGARFFQTQDFADLQVLSQLAWFDEFFLEQRDVVELVAKRRNYNEDDQRFVTAKQREIMTAVLPAHARAANSKPGEKTGHIEISTSPFYHPILPLLCDTDIAAISHPGVALPSKRFSRPEDAREQLQLGLDLHERVFGVRPRGVWPSEGSVSEQVLHIGHELGVQWMATDEGVLGRTIGYNFIRDNAGTLRPEGAHNLYRLWRYERRDTEMFMVFRDHALSDLIGFVYSGVDPRDGANDFLNRIRRNAEPVLRSGRDAVVPIILDGENAWEFYPRSGREFLRRVYDGIQQAGDMEALTISEAIDRQRDPAARRSTTQQRRGDGHMVDPVVGRLTSLVPGSWINANFDVWLGAPEDNRSWDYLAEARDFFAKAYNNASEAQRRLAAEELMIAEGSDWNWWYGPEHHTANDRDFDELYRKHLSNVYQALGATPPDYLAQPIAAAVVKPSYTPQAAYIRPKLSSEYARYFDWIGAAMYSAERRGGAMHGGSYLLDSIYAGIDEESVYARVDFIAGALDAQFDLCANIEALNQPKDGAGEQRESLRLEASIDKGVVTAWKLRVVSDLANPGMGKRDKSIAGSTDRRTRGVELRFKRSFEFKIPFSILEAELGSRLRIRFSIWRNGLPLDAMPVEGWLELPVVPEEVLEASVYNPALSVR